MWRVDSKIVVHLLIQALIMWCHVHIVDLHLLILSNWFWCWWLMGLLYVESWPTDARHCRNLKKNMFTGMCGYNVKGKVGLHVHVHHWLLIDWKITKLLSASQLDVMLLNNYSALNCVLIYRKTKLYTFTNVFIKNYEGFFTLFSN